MLQSDFFAREDSALKEKLQSIVNKSIEGLSAFISPEIEEEDIVKIIIAVLDEKHELANSMVSFGNERKQIGMETLDAIQHAVGILESHSSNNIIPKENYQNLMNNFKLTYEDDCDDLTPDKVVRKVLFEEILIKTNTIEDKT